MKKICNLFFILCFVSNLNLFAQNDSLVQYSKNCIYADVSFLLLCGSASLNYERLFTETSSVRAGIGVAALAGFNIGGGGHGYDVTATTIMYNLLSPGRHKFEIGGGISIPITGTFDNDFENYTAFQIGYRYHRKETGGFMFRLGFSHVYYYGWGFHLSLGRAF